MIGKFSKMQEKSQRKFFGFLFSRERGIRALYGSAHQIHDMIEEEKGKCSSQEAGMNQLRREISQAEVSREQLFAKAEEVRKQMAFNCSMAAQNRKEQKKLKEFLEYIARVERADLVRPLWEIFFMCFPVVTTTLHSLRKNVFAMMPVF